MGESDCARIVQPVTCNQYAVSGVPQFAHMLGLLACADPRVPFGGANGAGGVRNRGFGIAGENFDGKATRFKRS
jgi:hypothetical protein